MHIGRLAFEDEGGSARGYAQSADVTERIRKLFRHAIGEVLVGRVRAQVEKWQDGDGRGDHWFGRAKEPDSPPGRCGNEEHCTNAGRVTKGMGGRARDVQRERMVAKLEPGDVATLGNLDPQGRRDTLVRVVFLQPLAQFAGFDANDGIHFRVKIAGPVAHFNAEDQFLDAVGATSQRLLDDVSEETTGASGGDEWAAFQNRMQLLTHRLRRW